MEEQKKPFGLEKAEKKAAETLQNEKEISDVLERASEKAHRYRERLKEVWTDLEMLIEMVRAYRAGRYRHVPWKALIAATAALLYFLNPLDLIPDFLFGIGFLDDAAVIGFVINAIREEVERFRSFAGEMNEDAEADAASGNGKLSDNALAT